MNHPGPKVIVFFGYQYINSRGFAHGTEEAPRLSVGEALSGASFTRLSGLVEANLAR